MSFENLNHQNAYDINKQLSTNQQWTDNWDNVCNGTYILLSLKVYRKQQDGSTLCALRWHPFLIHEVCTQWLGGGGSRSLGRGNTSSFVMPRSRLKTKVF